MGVLRLILALSVVFWHAPGHILVLFNGGIAVVLFFIISGFYMALVITEKYSQLGSGAWIKAFYTSRVLRLAPAYLLVVLVEALWYLHTDTPSIFGPNDISILGRIALLFINLFILGQDTWQIVLTHAENGIPNTFSTVFFEIFGRSAFQPIYVFIGQAWSLGVELIFYLLAPFIVLSRKRVIGFFVACILVRLYFVEHADVFPNGPWRSRFFLPNMAFFCIGIASYWIYQKVSDIWWSRWIGAAYAIAGVTFIIVSLFASNGVLLFSGPEDYDEPRLWILYFIFSLGLPFLFLLTKEMKWDNYVGEISYPIYLVHGFLISWLNGYIGSRLNPAEKLGLFVFTTITVSILIYLFVDRPVDRFRHRVASFVANGNSHLSNHLRLVASAVIFILFIVVLLQPYSKNVAPPILIEVVARYNIVKYGDLYYGVPHGIPINWQKDNLESIPGVVIGGSSSSVVDSIRNK